MKLKVADKGRRRKRRGQPRLARGAWIVGATAIVLFVGLIAWAVRRHDALIVWRNSLAEGAATPWPAWNPTWAPLPRPPAKANAFAGDLHGPYAFTAVNRETVEYIPCYCGCRRDGHHSVLECFVKGFTADGRPIWTDHAFTCQTCVNIVQEVHLMSQRVMSLPAIRRSIDEHHGGLLSTPTDTPFPR